MPFHHCYTYALLLLLMVMPSHSMASASSSNPTNTITRQLAPYQRGINTYRHGAGITSGGGQALSDAGRSGAEAYMRRARRGDLQGPVTIHHQGTSVRCSIDGEGYLTCP